jgi:hypothetical protein
LQVFSQYGAAPQRPTPTKIPHEQQFRNPAARAAALAIYRLPAQNKDCQYVSSVFLANDNENENARSLIEKTNSFTKTIMVTKVTE